MQLVPKCLFSLLGIGDDPQDIINAANCRFDGFSEDYDRCKQYWVNQGKPILLGPGRDGEVLEWGLFQAYIQRKCFDELANFLKQLSWDVKRNYERPDIYTKMLLEFSNVMVIEGGKPFLEKVWQSVIRKQQVKISQIEKMDRQKSRYAIRAHKNLPKYQQQLAASLELSQHFLLSIGPTPQGPTPQGHV